MAIVAGCQKQHLKPQVVCANQEEHVGPLPRERDTKKAPRTTISAFRSVMLLRNYRARSGAQAFHCHIITGTFGDFSASRIDQESRGWSTVCQSTTWTSRMLVVPQGHTIGRETSFRVQSGKVCLKPSGQEPMLTHLLVPGTGMQQGRSFT